MQLTTFYMLRLYGDESVYRYTIHYNIIVTKQHCFATGLLLLLIPRNRRTATCHYDPGGGGGGKLPYKRDGVLVENLEKNP